MSAYPLFFIAGIIPANLIREPIANFISNIPRVLRIVSPSSPRISRYAKRSLRTGGTYVQPSFVHGHPSHRHLA